MHSTFTERRAQLNQSCKEEGFISIHLALIMCETVDPYKSRAERVAYEIDIKAKLEKSLGDSRIIGYE